MLLQFVVENYKSFRAETTLNLVPAKSRIHKGHVLVDKVGRRVQALPLAVLYGANASGKSNLVKAMAFAQKLIVHGTRGEEPIAAVPFALEPACRGRPCRFEFILKHDGILYSYGFLVSAQKVEEEWLFSTPKSRETRLFERVTRGAKAVVEAGSQLAAGKAQRQRIQFVAQGTRPNQLFLTEAAERNVEEILPLMRWFRDRLEIILPDAQYQALTPRAYSDTEFTQFLSRLLRLADTGIDALGTSMENVEFDQRFPNMPEEVKRSVLDKLACPPGQKALATGETALVTIGYEGSFYTIGRRGGSEKPFVLRLKTRHKSSAGSLIDFDTEDESDGTQRIMHLAPLLLDLQRNEKVYVVDELDRSMHPLLCRFLVEAFLQGVVTNKSKGQLLVTTHETHILDLDLLRRDEIWFVEKDAHGSTHLSSLAEFKDTRADLKVSKGYLQGRFGAIPYLGDVRRLFGRTRKATNGVDLPQEAATR